MAHIPPFRTGFDADYCNDFACPKCCTKFSMDNPYNDTVVIECPECGHIFQVSIYISFDVEEV